MERIKKISHLLSKLLSALLIILPIAIVLQWIFIETAPVRNLFSYGIFLNYSFSTDDTVIYLSKVNWTTVTKWIGFSSSLLSLLPILLGLAILKSIFKNYEHEEIFTTRNALHYRNLASLFFFNALLVQPLSYLLMVLSMTLSNPPGQRYISVNFGIPNLESLFFGAILVLLSWVMVEASRLHDEQLLTV